MNELDQAIPDFKSEDEEANWWASPEGQKNVLESFKQATKDGTLRRGTLKNQMETSENGMSVRAKMTVTHHLITRMQGHEGAVVHMNAVASGNPEDNTFATATPFAQLQMQVDNPEALTQLVPGKTFYVDFTEA